MEHKEPSKDYEIFMYKNQLQEFTQKSALPLPKYQTFNEGEAHAPRFRSPVLVDGVAYTSPHSFFHQRASEQDVAKIALEILSKKIESENENEGVSFILKDATSCKSILHEYAVKMNLGKPTYTTSRAEGIVPVFTSSSHFNGQTYTGDLAKSKKEAEQLAVHAVIESILANSNTRALMCEIIRSKRKLYATFSKKDSSPRLSSERKVPSRSHTQNDTVIGKIVFVNSTNTKVPEMICSGDEKIAKSTATETFTPEAKKFEEEYTCELSSGTNGNDSSQPTLPLGGSITASNTSNPSEGPLAHVRVNNGEKLIEPSTNRPEDSQDVVLLSGIRRSDTAENGGNKSKKARIIEQYVPSFLPPASKGREPEKKKDDEKPKEKEKGKPRAIDNFLEELKLEQELREKRNQEREQWREGRHGDSSALPSRFDELPDDFDPSGKLPGSFDDGDPQTTNLYVGNLSPQVDENFLLRTFGRFGPIASVKIMWPRTEEERRRQRNCGFVAFMNRADGQAAKDEMQGVVVYEYELKIGWGKSVSLPAQALPAPPPGHMAIRNKEGATVILSGPDGPAVTSVTSQSSELVLTPNIPDILVVPPEDKHLRHVIDTMALHVLDGGCAFEQAIMERGRGNPLFNFLFELGSKEHTYYVWRLYSFAQGDTLQRWRTEPFIMITGSGRWIPPSLPPTRSPEHEKESSSTYAAGRSRRVELERTLTDPQRDEFEDMLRALTLERSQIKEAMGFALDNADAAGEVVEVLTESLTLKETPIPTKVARLMLVSDILHNSSAPVKNASAYRTKFEGTLPDIMESFNDLYRSITGRITAEALKERVLKVLQVWADWFLFSDAYVNGLRATFLRSGNSGVVPFHSICGDAPEIENKGSSEDILEGNKINQDAALAMGKGAAMQELLSLPLTELERRCRHNGLSLCGGREMMVARLLNLEEVEKQRGYDRDEEMRYMQSHSGKYPREDESWNANNAAGRREANHGSEPISSTKRNRHEEMIQGHGKGSSVSSTPTVAIPQPELRAFPGKKGKSDPVLPASKWAREDDGSDDEDKKAGRGLGLSYSSSGSENSGGGPEKADEADMTTDSGHLSHPESSMSEEHRQKLRRLEVAVMEYHETLEERGIRNPEEIEKKVASYRRRLQSEFGLLDSIEGSSRQSSQRTSMERKGRRDDGHDSSRKRHRSQSRSRSPQKRSSTRDRERESDADRDRDRHRERDRSYDAETERGREREKSGSRERDDHERDRTRERERDRRRKGK